MNDDIESSAAAQEKPVMRTPFSNSKKLQQSMGEDSEIEDDKGKDIFPWVMQLWAILR